MRLIIVLALTLVVTASQAQIAPRGQGENKISFIYSIEGYFKGSKFYAPRGLAVDEGHNLVYISDADNNSVFGFSTQGIAKFQIGINKELKAPSALAVDREGNLYVAEAGKAKIKIFNTDNEMAEVIDVAGICEGAGPVARMEVARDGSLYVVDQANQQIIVLDPDRKLRLKFGQLGTDRGQFKNIEDVAVDRQGRIYVTDSTGVPVQVFDRKGKYVYRFGQRGALEEDFVQPTAIAIDRFDRVWVTDTSEHSIKIFDRTGFFLKSSGDYGLGEGSLFYPIDLYIDAIGKVYVLQRGLPRLQVFSVERPLQPFERR